MNRVVEVDNLVDNGRWYNWSLVLPPCCCVEGEYAIWPVSLVYFESYHIINKFCAAEWRKMCDTIQVKLVERVAWVDYYRLQNPNTNFLPNKFKANFKSLYYLIKILQFKLINCIRCFPYFIRIWPVTQIFKTN